jgi:hypothetical protein
MPPVHSTLKIRSAAVEGRVTVALADLIGANVKHVMVHDSRAMYLADGAVLQCSGAVDIWTEDYAIVLRSQLRYSRPPLSSVEAGQPSSDATVTICSHEEADRLSSGLGPRWEPKLMGSQVIVAFDPIKAEVCLRSSDGEDTWITYRADLDGSWFMARSPEPFVVDAIRLAGCDDAFGWLLPKAPYILHWDGWTWQTLALAWSCSDKPKPEVDRYQMFRQLYCMRLMQHPNLLRRFMEFRYPIECPADPWLAVQLTALQSEVFR